MGNSNTSFGKFLFLWSGELVSAIGSGLTSFGLAVYVFRLTGSATLMAMLTLLAFVPALLLSPAAGVLADRYDRRILMILGDSLSALGLIFILGCMLLGNVQLWQIYVGVTISSIFSSLLEPAYKATVSDLLTKEQYSKASGLVQIAGSSKFLISPILAGFLLSIWDIKLLLIIDICTFFFTVSVTSIVRKGLVSNASENRDSFIGEFKEGWKVIHGNRGIFILVLLTSVITFFLGFIQILSTPMILAFSNTATLGTIETICASGMLVSSILIGVFSIRGGYVNILSVSLFCTGIFMALFGLRENVFLICTAGFLFFATLPFANTSIDVLIRKNLENSVQGRAWGLIGVISQLGYVVAFALAGILADYLFTPMLLPGGLLASSIGKLTGTGEGRGIGLLILVSGFFVLLTSLLLARSPAVKRLENANV
ncbi:Major Facilitator Superfamily transporter [Sphaerochaeta pleomorpha str. Grapes]|uniref:Major Facilitator Superfamily transporter n=1 Tax=Sphaerochaeta pleomorpha (strain ATCC BAA-1885 / DSM 22778 / Grapes) TaxID=158190 RepID=G8QQR2_SPHPG|nr:MFS transporter [Sphaerochaeta pleomorpha]AEV28693.1 Major Facilitator Superfamily transporter [Sphaerochaeta pleomorpha str. Grapes]